MILGMFSGKKLRLWGFYEVFGGCRTFTERRDSTHEALHQLSPRTAGEKLWASIKPSGFGSERFKLHLSPTFATGASWGVLVSRVYK